MAEAGSGSLEYGSQNSSGGSSGETALKKNKGPKVVKSRYLHYDKTKTAKLNVANTTVSSAGKVSERGRGRGTPTRRSVVPQRFKAPSDKHNTPAAADGSIIWKDDLQSTLLDGHKIALPELDFSVINDKTIQKSTLKPPEQRKPKRECVPKTNLPEDLSEMLESQTLLFTYLTMKMQKNLNRLEEKAERNLFIGNEEKNQLQEKVYNLKRNLLLYKREEQFNELLEKQAESLSPSSAAMKQFKEHYTSFATALDCTRHQLPIKDVHIVGTRQRYLEEIQKPLSVAKSLLEETISCSTNENIDLSSTIKSLQNIVLKTDEELSRTSRQVMDLSFKVNKEISLQSQKLVEEKCDMEVVRQWYFDQTDI